MTYRYACCYVTSALWMTIAVMYPTCHNSHYYLILKQALKYLNPFSISISYLDLMKCIKLAIISYHIVTNTNRCLKRANAFVKPLLAFSIRPIFTPILRYRRIYSSNSSSIIFCYLRKPHQHLCC